MKGKAVAPSCCAEFRHKIKFVKNSQTKMKTANSAYGGYSSVGRAPDCGSGCRGFESHLSPHYRWGIAKR